MDNDPSSLLIVHGHFSDNTAKITFLNVLVVFASLTDCAIALVTHTHISSNRHNRNVVFIVSPNVDDFCTALDY